MNLRRLCAWYWCKTERDSWVQCVLRLCRGESGEEMEAGEHVPGFYSKGDLSPAQTLHGLEALSPCVHGFLAWGHLPHLNDLPLSYPGNWFCAPRPGPGTLQVPFDREPLLLTDPPSLGLFEPKIRRTREWPLRLFSAQAAHQRR